MPKPNKTPTPTTLPKALRRAAVQLGAEAAERQFAVDLAEHTLPYRYLSDLSWSAGTASRSAVEAARISPLAVGSFEVGFARRIYQLDCGRYPPPTHGKKC